MFTREARVKVLRLYADGSDGEGVVLHLSKRWEYPGFYLVRVPEGLDMYIEPERLVLI